MQNKSSSKTQLSNDKLNIKGLFGQKKVIEEKPVFFNTKKLRNSSCSPQPKGMFEYSQSVEKKLIKLYYNQESSSPHQDKQIQQQQTLAISQNFDSFNSSLNQSPNISKKHSNQTVQVGQMSQIGQVGSNNNIFQSEKVSPLKLYEIKEKPNKKQQKAQSKQLKLKLTQLKDIKPMNLEQEKKIFFQKGAQYDPIFMYSMNDIIFFYQKPHTKYFDLAKKILDQVLITYRSETDWNIQDGGNKLSQEETAAYFSNYINNLEIQDQISYEFAENTVAQTSCIHSNTEGFSKVVIGLPIQYRKNRIMGVLNHEIGTHFIRKYNDKFQKWHKHRKKYDMQPYSKIEEGLATINQLYESGLSQTRKPYLFRAALLYYACVMSSKMSFQELFKMLGNYIEDPEDIWQYCVRVKRGIADTSQLQGQYKDQIYFRGVIKILKNRRQLNFINLHAGKISVNDCIRLTEKNVIQTDKIKVPYFLQNINLYLKVLDRIAEVNFLN